VKNYVGGNGGEYLASRTPMKARKKKADFAERIMGAAPIFSRGDYHQRTMSKFQKKIPFTLLVPNLPLSFHIFSDSGIPHFPHVHPGRKKNR
jgi:hypothetical protein